MTRALGVCVAVASLLVGCVSIGEPSAQPSVGQSVGITTPVPVPSATPSASATATAIPSTEEPTPSPTAVATSTPTAEPTGTPAPANADLVFVDNMDDPTSGWGLGSLQSRSVAYAEGALRMTIAEESDAVWSTHVLPAEYSVIRVAAQFTMAARGGVGLMCATPDNVLYGAEITTRGELLFFSIENGVTNALSPLTDLDLDVQVGEPVLFGLECAGSATGALRLVPVMTDTGPLGIYQVVDGPSTFSRVAVYSEAFEQGFSADVDPVAAYAIAGSPDGMTPEGEELLTHVPEDWQQTCYESPVTETPTAIIQCVLQTEGVGVELAQYEQSASNADMDADYQEVIETYGVEPTDSCESGPNETSWNIQGDTFGRVQCAPQKVGIRFDWTDDRLSILSTLIDFDGDYENSYKLWQDAGPNP